MILFMNLIIASDLLVTKPANSIVTVGNIAKETTLICFDFPIIYSFSYMPGNGIVS